MEDDGALSEDVFRKSVRGRPRVWTAEHEAFWRRVMECPPGTTLRAVQDFSFTGEALCALGGEVSGFPKEAIRRWAWLLRCDGDGQSHCRKSIMSQLGRMAHLLSHLVEEGKDVEVVQVFADRLCELKPTARDAIRLLRDWQARLDGTIWMRFARHDYEFDVTALAVKIIEKNQKDD